jgi:hypothetical protein
MEVVQYRSNQSPRVIVTDSMANTSGLDSVPFSALWGSIKNNKTWTDGRCAKGS